VRWAIVDGRGEWTAKFVLQEVQPLSRLVLTAPTVADSICYWSSVCPAWTDWKDKEAGFGSLFMNGE
jgi:hypothetical protein